MIDDIKIRENNKLIPFINLNNGNYDLNPPYQRDCVWNTKLKEDLMYSVIKGITLPPVHLVYKDDDEIQSNVLDGKQRISTIISFLNGEFPINVPTFSKKLTWEQIKSKRNKMNGVDSVQKKECDKIYAKINDGGINAVVYSQMPLISQIELFRRINNSMPLTNSEKFVGENIYAKHVLKYVNSLIPDYLKKINLISGKSKRGKDIEFAGYLLGGLSSLSVKNCSPDFNVFKKKTTKDLQKYIIELDNEIKNYISKTEKSVLSDDTEIVNMLKSDIFCNGKYSVVDDFCKFINTYVYKCIGDYTKYGYYFVLYFSIFMCDKYDKKYINKSFIDANINKFKELYDDYLDFISEDKEYTRRASSEKKAELFDSLERLYLKSFTNDVRYKPFTKKQKEDVLNKYSVCQLSGCNSSEDLQVDHVDPNKSIASVLCARHNRQKQDGDPDTLRKLADYTERALKENEQF